MRRDIKKRESYIMSWIIDMYNAFVLEIQIDRYIWGLIHFVAYRDQCLFEKASTLAEFEGLTEEEIAAFFELGTSEHSRDINFEREFTEHCVLCYVKSLPEELRHHVLFGFLIEYDYYRFCLKYGLGNTFKYMLLDEPIKKQRNLFYLLVGGTGCLWFVIDVVWWIMSNK